MAFLKIIQFCGYGILTVVAFIILTIVLAFLIELIKVFFGKGGKGNE